MRPLSTLEARALAVLVEKQATVPDTYPLSLNALLAGINQKTARAPVMEATESETLVALDGLKALSLVFEVSGSRVVRFEHNMARVLAVPGAAVALLTVLMLRGPQTAAELRLNSERLHRFADISSVEAFLDELAHKAEPLVRLLPRAPGEREQRWIHCLSMTNAGLDGGPPPARAAVDSPAAEPPARVAAAAATAPAVAAAAAGLRFVLPAEKKPVHRMRIPLRWGDMDAMGHINNTLYFRYMEIVRLDWMFAHGAGVDAGRSGGEGPVIVNAFCNFLRQLSYPGEIEVSMFVANPGRSSFDTFHTIERVDEPGLVFAEGGARVVWMDYGSGRSAPMPEWFRAHLL